jgi:Na+/H+ antiporter NhaB
MIIVSDHAIESLLKRSKSVINDADEYVKNQITLNNQVFKKKKIDNNHKDPSLYFISNNLVFVVSSKSDAYIVSTVYRNERRDRFCK